jgi:hypothetical protein
MHWFILKILLQKYKYIKILFIFKNIGQINILEIMSLSNMI